MKEKRGKKIIGSCLLMLCVLIGMMSLAVCAQDSENTKTVHYTSDYTYTEEQYVQNGVRIAPTEPGYLFAGWFTSEDGENFEAVNVPQDKAVYYAKFVPEEVLTVKAQVSDTLYDEDETNDSQVAIRFITTIDQSKDYKHVGFNIQKGDADAKDAPVSNYVYRTLYSVDATKDSDTVSGMTPEGVFHSTSYYFKTWTIKNVTSDTYNKEVTVIPYWETLDGTRVEGAKAIKTVNMGRSWIYVDTTDTESQELGTYDEPYKTMADAMNCTTPVDPTIILKSDITLTDDNTLVPTKSMTITTDNNDRTIKISPDISTNPIKINESGIDVAFKGSSASNRLIIEGTADTNGIGKMLMYFQLANSVTMEHVDIEKAHRSTGGGGGAIYNSVTLTLTDCTFKNCQRSSNNGGAIMMNEGSLMATKCMFYECKASDGGGAINVTGGKLRIKGSSFENCTASNNGGAINVTSGELTIEDSSFKNCSANNNGGAINSNSEIEVKGGTFINNSAENGGAIYADVTSVTFSEKESTFNNCTATASGGAVYLNSAKVDATTESKFTSCTANTSGGAIYYQNKNNSDVYVKDQAWTLAGCTFDKCSSGQGGAIFYTAHSDKFTLSNCEFKQCGNNDTITTSSGGAIHVGNENTIIIKTCTFSENKAKNYGGAVSIGTASSTLHIKGTCCFTKNTVQGNGKHFGGAMLAPKNLYINSEANVTMTDNQCTKYECGDAISINDTVATYCIIYQNATLTITDTVDNSTEKDICFKDNESNGNGVAATLTTSEDTYDIESSTN